MVFTDTCPIVDPHVMIIPKRHIRGLIDLYPEEWEDFYSAHAYAYVQVKNGSTKEPFVFVNAPQDQSVKHLHIHVFPGVFGVHGVDKALRTFLKGGENI